MDEASPPETHERLEDRDEGGKGEAGGWILLLAEGMTRVAPFDLAGEEGVRERHRKEGRSVC